MKKKSRILIVDDEKINITVLRGALKPDYIIQAAKNGYQAIEISTESLPDLILLDIVMPEMDGYEICNRLKSNDKTKHIPIIFLTSMSDSRDETKGLMLGAVDYITKPINAEIVKARVKHHLEREAYKNHLEELVTERTLELQAAKVVAEEANRAKSTFLMNMSHELRTPLNAIQVCTDMITGFDSIDEIKMFRDLIASSGNALLSLIEQILEFTKSKDGKLRIENQPFKLSEALQEIRTEFMHRGNKIQFIPLITFDGDDIPDNLIGDAKHLLAILNPLLENAAKFTLNKPEVTLTMKLLDKSEQNISIEFAVSDKGIGIHSDHLKTIFEPFTQVDDSSTREFDGTGMGLPLCKQLITLMGGEIWVESELEKGSTFYFTLPFTF